MEANKSSGNDQVDEISQTTSSMSNLKTSEEPTSTSTYSEQIQSSVSSAYQSLPTFSGMANSVGLGSLVGTTATETENQNQNQNESQEEEKSSDQVGEKQEEDEKSSSLKERARAQSIAAGPSCQSRVGKDQKSIGTEIAIPTAAGPGSTLSPDLDAMKASKGAESSQAKVPQDYEPCLSAQSQSTTVQQALASDENADSDSEEKRADDSGDGSGDGDGTQKKSFGEKFKNKIKGQSKVIKGTLTGDQEVKDLGKAIKQGNA